MRPIKVKSLIPILLLITTAVFIFCLRTEFEYTGQLLGWLFALIIASLLFMHTEITIFKIAGSLYGIFTTVVITLVLSELNGRKQIAALVIYMAIFTMFSAFYFMFSKHEPSDIEILETGLKKDSHKLFTPLFAKWDSFSEVGIGTSTFMDWTIKWIYFSKESLDEDELQNLHRFKQNGDMLRIPLTGESLAKVREYCPKEIRNLTSEIEEEIA